MAFDELREDYNGNALRKEECASDPKEQFQRWFDQALQQKVEMANAMTLATVDAEGAPQVRIVLLKELDSHGFVFYTNYDSAKGKELQANKRVSLLFYWYAMHRQIRIEGVVSKVDGRTSDEYFATRPRESNIAAIASAQSEVLASREELLSQIAAVKERVGNAELIRPKTGVAIEWCLMRLSFGKDNPIVPMTALSIK
ncbi:MAG: pyridoxamine 5'-phosphate oxidase [Kofleriaceae bacterium]|nr:pyridoxamine 5'-phosphate oxidase [Kofleriaceae bacterium]